MDTASVMFSSGSDAANGQAESGSVGTTSTTGAWTFVELGRADAIPGGERLAAIGGWIGADAESEGAVRVAVLTDGGARCLGAAIVAPAEQSRFRALSRLSDEGLARSIAVGDVRVDPEHASAVLPVLMYLALRRGRIWDRATVAAYSAEGSGAARLVGLERLVHLAPITVGAETLTGGAQRLDIAIQRAWSACAPATRESLRSLFAPEAVETLERWIGRFFQTAWFKAIHDGTMTRQQYVYTISNMHQFVRFTTRLIARAAGWSNDSELRSHWLERVGGELNHEKIIEKDLSNLGADVDYVVKTMVPNVANYQFVIAQQSVLDSDRDPILFMAPPFVAEGFSAHLNQEFIRAMESVVSSWGVEKPAHVISFFRSHVEYDGGDDGHWEQSRQMLNKFLVDDNHLTKFLTVARVCMKAFEQSYASYVEELAVFAAKPAAEG